jgi:hypothetical protein
VLIIIKDLLAEKIKSLTLCYTLEIYFNSSHFICEDVMYLLKMRCLVHSLHLGLKTSHFLAHAILALLEVHSWLLELEGSMLSNSLLLLLGSHRVLADGLVSLFIHGFERVSSKTSLNIAAELLLVTLRVVLLELTHVIGNVTTKDVLAQNFGISSVCLAVEAWETLVAVRDVKTTIDGTLHGREDLGTSGGSGQTSVEEGLERTGTVLLVKLSLVQAKVSEDTTSAEKTSAVGSSIVGQTNLDTIVGELMGVGRGKDKVTLNLGIDHLANNVSVGDTDNQTILGGVILVLVLDDQALAGIVVSLSLAAAAVFDLVAFEVSLIFNNLDEWLEIRTDGWGI